MRRNGSFFSDKRHWKCIYCVVQPLPTVYGWELKLLTASPQVCRGLIVLKVLFCAKSNKTKKVEDFQRRSKEVEALTLQWTICSISGLGHFFFIYKSATSCVTKDSENWKTPSVSCSQQMRPSWRLSAEPADHKAVVRHHKSVIPKGYNSLIDGCHKGAGISQQAGVCNCEYKACHTRGLHYQHQISHIHSEKIVPDIYQEVIAM